jgi:LmbE family N-acetylglucosaminyl deacetylase
MAMRFCRENGNPLYVAVATSGANGVEDEYCSPPTREAKAHLRKKEQRASCQFFGLSEDRLAFLRLEEDRDGHPVEDSANLERLRQHFLSIQPTAVFLPHGNDTNPGHHRIYAMFHQVAQGAGYPLVAFLNRDPKTTRMRCDVYCEFGDDQATWKGQLLRFHQSQHQRNLNQRGHGFDQRILKMDLANARSCPTTAPYAEVFELEVFGGRELEGILGGR